MAINPLAGKKVPDQVKDEFTARGDGAKLAKWAATRQPWIHIMSMASTCNADFNMMKSGGNLDAYGTPKTGVYIGGDVGRDLPNPIVTNVDITAQGKLGTTRKGIVKFRVYTDEQLNEIQKCYFIPGMDVRVQFGWNITCDGSEPELPYTAIDTRAVAGCNINFKRRQGTGYDGLQGPVTSFKQSLSPEGYWECSMEIIAAADAFYGSNVSNDECPCTRVKTQESEAKGQDDVKVVYKYGNLYSCFTDSFNSLYSATDYLNKLLAKYPSASGDAKVCTLGYMGKARTEGGGDDSSWYEGTWFNDYDTAEQYLSFGMLEIAINAYCVPGGTTPGNDETKMPNGQLRSTGVLINAGPSPHYVMCADPRIAWIPGGDGDSFVKKLGGSNGTAYTGGGMVNLNKIMFNALFLKQELKSVIDGDGKLKTFIDNILSKLNKNCGSIWDFQVISDGGSANNCNGTDPSYGGPIISVVDASLYEQEETYQIPTKSDNAAVRSFSLDMKLSDGMKTQAVYSSGPKPTGRSNTPDGGDVTGCEDASMVAFGMVGGTVENNAVPTIVPNPKCDCDEVSGVESESEPSFYELKKAMVWDDGYVCDETVAAMNSKLVQTIQEAAAKESEGGTKVPVACGNILPYDFNFECDGMGGLEWGHVVSADRIPDSIKNKYQWFVTKVTQKVTANDWSTNVNTMARTVPE